MKISEIIELSSAFAAEVNVARDFKYRLTEKNQHIDGYLPTTSSRNIVKTILETVAIRDDRKLHLITASYGTGKSYLLLMLAHLLGNNKSEILEEFRKKIADKDAYHKDNLSQTLENYVGKNDSYLVIIPEYGSDDFEQSLFVALNEALKKNGISFVPKTHYSRAYETLEHWKTTNSLLFKQLENKLSNISGEQFINLLQSCDNAAYQDFKKFHKELIGSDFSENHGNAYQAFAETAKEITKSGYKGIVILYDEFGAVLDKLINRSSVSSTLKIQEFIEKVKNKENNANIILVAASHQDPSIIQENKRESINKVIGRFEKHLLTVEASESEELLGMVFITKDSVEKKANLQEDLVKQLTDETQKFRLYPHKDANWIEQKLVNNLYPLHPLTAFILPRLSREYAQNNRSMFNFLSPKGTDIGSFFNFLSKTEVKESNGKINLFTPNLLLDYFKKNLKEAKSESITNLVDAYETAIGREIDLEVIKLFDNILLLTSTRSGEVKPTFEMLHWAMLNKNKQDLKFLLDDLVQNEKLEFNLNDQTYKFLEFGSKSLTKIIQEEINKLGELTISSCNDIWEEIEPRGNFYFDEHNESCGANRKYQNLSITNEYVLDTSMSNLKKFYQWEGDYNANGYNIFLLGKSEIEIDTLKETTRKYDEISKYFVLASPKDFNIFETLQSKTLEYQGLKNSSDRPEVIGNINHAERLKSLINETRSKLSNLIKELYEPKNWLWSFYENIGLKEFKNVRSLKEAMNEYISEVFNAVPKIKDDALWFVKGATGRQFREKALSDILMAEKDRIPLVDSNNKAAPDRIVENFFKNLQLTQDRKNNQNVLYGEIKQTTPHTPIHTIWNLIDKNLKLGEHTAPESVIRPLLNAPFGLSENIAKFILTCFIRVNKEILIISDAKRTTQAYEKTPTLIEDIFKKPQNFRIRKIEMSGPEIRYLGQLNGLFIKENPVSMFGEVARKFEGLIQFFMPLHHALIRDESNSEIIIFYKSLHDFKELLTDNSVNRESESKAFFTEILPSIILNKTKDDFENDPDNIRLIIEKIREYKDFPQKKEIEFRFSILQDLAKKVFDTSINSQEDFKACVKNWFLGLRDSTRNEYVFENPRIKTWMDSLKGTGSNNDISKLYLEELIDKSIKDWDRLSYEQLTLIQTYKDYKNEVEQYTKNPLLIYQYIVRESFGITLQECGNVDKFVNMFSSWWNQLTPLSREHHFEESHVNIFIDIYKSSYSTKDKFLVQMPVLWNDSGSIQLTSTQWEDWTQRDIRELSEQYKKSVEIINNWKPPIEENDFYEAIGNLFDIQLCNEVLSLQEEIRTTWFHNLPVRTQSNVWEEKSDESKFMTALTFTQFRELLIVELPKSWNFSEFKNWNKDILSQYLNKIAILKSRIESFRRPTFAIIQEIEKKSKDKSTSVFDFRIKLREHISNTEAYKCSAEQDELLLTDENSRTILKILRRLSSDKDLESLFASIADILSLNQENHYWTPEEQSRFANEYHRCMKFIREWKFPEDVKMDTAKKKIRDEIETMSLTKSQLLKILKDIIAENE